MVKDCQIGLELAECRGSVAWTDAGVATETSSVETLLSVQPLNLFPAHLRVGNRIDLRLACCFSMRADAPSIGGCSVSMISADRCAFVTRIGLVLARPLPIECRWG